MSQWMLDQCVYYALETKSLFIFQYISVEYLRLTLLVTCYSIISSIIYMPDLMISTLTEAGM